MKGYFYHSSIRKYVILMGNLFSNIYVARGDNYRKVPITVSSKEQFVASLNSQELNGDNMVANVSTMLPRIGLDMVSCTYDGTRKTNVTNRQITRDDTADRPAMNRLFNPVPYDFEFEVSIYTRHQDDAFQIIEQILPYFQPQFNTMIKELDESEVVIDKRDIPIILESAVPETTFEGDAGEMRHIEWTLNMRLKGWLYPPTNVQFGEIRTIYLNFQEEETEVTHAPRVVVDASYDFIWNIRNDVSIDSEFAWRSSIEQMYGSTWNTRGLIDSSVDVDWFIRPQISSDVVLEANVRSLIESVNNASWDVSPTVTTSAAIDWSYQTDVAAELNTQWNALSFVSSDSGLNWGYQHSVDSPDVEIAWNNTVTASSSVDVDYSIKSEVTADELSITYLIE